MAFAVYHIACTMLRALLQQAGSHEHVQLMLSSACLKLSNAHEQLAASVVAHADAQMHTDFLQAADGRHQLLKALEDVQGVYLMLCHLL